MALVVVYLLLWAFIGAYGVNSNATDLAEGVICRSYFLAKNHDMVDTCRTLWNNAEVNPQGVESLDCRICKHMIRNRSFNALVSVLQGSQVCLFLILLL